MNQVKKLIEDVAEARLAYLKQTEQFTEQNALWKPSAEAWNVIEVTEHLYWAEHGGILGMWKTLHAIRSGQHEKTFDFKFKSLPIEVIIQRTWQDKEKVPAVAAPRMGGTLLFWKSALASLQSILDEFGKDIKEDELRIQAHPHPISGPMDFHQRLEFLTFHIRRHFDQVENLLKAKLQASS